MKYHRTVLAVVGISLLTGLGFAYGSVKNTTQQVRDGNEALVNFTDADLSNKGSIQKITALKATIKRLSTKLAALEASPKPNPDRGADIAALKATIKRLSTKLAALEASPKPNPDRGADIAALKATIKRLSTKLAALEASPKPNPDRGADIAALKATIKRLSAKLAFLEASQKPNPEKRAVIVALKARIESLQDRLQRLHASPPTNQDRREDILRLKARIAKLRLALWNLRHDKEQLSRKDRSLRGSDSDSFQRDGDERIQHLKHQGLQDNPHREAIREIEQGSHQRLASLYSPAHKSGFHARMHRHTR